MSLEKLEQVRRNNYALSVEVERIDENVDDLRGEVKDLKTDLNSFKDEFKQEFNEFKLVVTNNFTELKGEMKTEKSEKKMFFWIVSALVTIVSSLFGFNADKVKQAFSDDVGTEVVKPQP